jgi:hypothetical protein
MPLQDAILIVHFTKLTVDLRIAPDIAPHLTTYENFFWH